MRAMARIAVLRIGPKPQIRPYLVGEKAATVQKHVARYESSACGIYRDVLCWNVKRATDHIQFNFVSLLHVSCGYSALRS